MLFYYEMAALFVAALLIRNKDNKSLALILFAVPAFHSSINQWLSDWQYYHFAFIEDFAIFMYIYARYKLLNKADLFHITIGFTQILFMMAQISGWIMYEQYMPPTIYDEACGILFIMQILILMTTGGAVHELTAMARRYSDVRYRRSGRSLDIRNGDGLQ